jgi:hypothetical protein
VPLQQVMSVAQIELTMSMYSSGKEPKFKAGITIDRAKELLRLDMSFAEHTVEHFVTVRLTQG